MIVYEPDVQTFSSAFARDEYNPEYNRIPSDEFVVTKNIDGSPLSRYGDLSWNRTPYQTVTEPCNLHFDYWVKGRRFGAGSYAEKETARWRGKKNDFTPARKQIVGELHWIMFILIHLRPGKPLSNQSLVGYGLLLRKLANVAEAQGKMVSDILSSTGYMHTEIKRHYNSRLIPLLKLLNQLGPETTGIEVTCRHRKMANLVAMAKEYRDSCKQTPPMPTRIYSHVLDSLSRELADFDSVSDRILSLYAECAADPLLGKCVNAQNKIIKQLGVNTRPDGLDFPSLLRAHNLEDFWKQRGYPMMFPSLSTVFTDFFKIASRQIQAYSGMRQNELQELPFDCLDEVYRAADGKIHYLICGRVTKLTGGKIKRVRWVTSNSGRSAILLAKRFSQAIYMAAGAHPQADKQNINSFPLFISSTYGIKKRKRTITNLKNLDLRLRVRLVPTIIESDLRELELVDPDRDWHGEEKFQLGKLWPFAGHQLRRSLALYAQASGLVSLPSLKRQLQHITREMALYYSRGSQFAKNFLGETRADGHFGQEWQAAQPLSQYLAYTISVLMADPSEMFGTHTQFVNSHLRNEQGAILIDRAQTLKHFEKGELAFRETLVGGCTKVGKCEQNPLELFNVDCMTNHCKNMVGSKKKLAHAITIQRNFVDKLGSENANTPEFRHEKANLLVLVDVQAKAFAET
jgi:hypothetical protein